MRPQPDRVWKLHSCEQILRPGGPLAHHTRNFLDLLARELKECQVFLIWRTPFLCRLSQLLNWHPPSHAHQICSSYLSRLLLKTLWGSWREYGARWDQVYCIGAREHIPRRKCELNLSKKWLSKTWQSLLSPVVAIRSQLCCGELRRQGLALRSQDAVV